MKMALAVLALLTAPYANAAATETVWSCKGTVYNHEYNEVMEITEEHGDNGRLIVEYTPRAPSKNAKKITTKKDFGTLTREGRMRFVYTMADQKETTVLPPGRFRDDGDGIAAKFTFVYPSKYSSRKESLEVLCKRPYTEEETKKNEEPKA